MNILPKSKQIEIVAALCEGVGVRATARLTDTNRKTVARVALQVGIGCAEFHDRTMNGIRVNRLELDELWSFVAKKQARVQRHELFAKGDQYVFIGMAGTQKAIIGFHVGKRDRTTPTSSFAICGSASSACRKFRPMAFTRIATPSATPSAIASLMASCIRPTA